MARTGYRERTTKETTIVVEIDLDGETIDGVGASTGIPFFDHMLDQ